MSAPNIRIIGKVCSGVYLTRLVQAANFGQIFFRFWSETNYLLTIDGIAGIMLH